MTIALLEKKIEDLSDVIYTLEQRIDKEHVYRKSLQHDLNTLNHFVAKMKKWELGSHFNKAWVIRLSVIVCLGLLFSSDG